MLKLTFCLRRKAGLSRAEFQKYWRETHGPLVRECAPALGIKRYVQAHTGYDELNAALQAGRGGPEAYDGVALLWWESRAAFEAAAATAEGRRAGAKLLEDERRFIDHAKSPLWMADEIGVL